MANGDILVSFPTIRKKKECVFLRAFKGAFSLFGLLVYSFSVIALMASLTNAYFCHEQYLCIWSMRPVLVQSHAVCTRSALMHNFIPFDESLNRRRRMCLLQKVFPSLKGKVFTCQMSVCFVSGVYF